MTANRLTPKSPLTLSAPVLGTPESGTLTNCTGLPISSGVSGLGSGVATFLGEDLTTTGTGAVVYGTRPTLTVQDADFTLQDNLTNSKQLRFELSGISNSTTRVLTVPNFDGTIATLSGAETLSNKALRSISDITSAYTTFDLTLESPTLENYGTFRFRQNSITAFKMSALYSTANPGFSYLTLNSLNDVDGAICAYYAGSLTYGMGGMEFSLNDDTSSNFRKYVYDDNQDQINLITSLGKNLTFGGSIAVSGSTSGSTVIQAASTASGTWSLPAATDTFVGLDSAQELSNKTFVSPVLGTPTSGTLTNCTGLPVSTGISGLGSGVAAFLGSSFSSTGTGSVVYGTRPTLTVQDSDFTIQDNSDNTKQLKFEISGFSVSSTRTITVPNITDTMVTATATQNLTNKTITSGVFLNGTISNAIITYGSGAIIGSSGSEQNITTSQSGRFLSDTSDSNKNYGVLPSAATGLNYLFHVRSSDGLRIIANTDDSIRVLGSITPTAGYIESTTVGDFITLLAIDADTWLAVNIGGSWTVST